MSSLEEEIRELQEQNYELVKAAQNWKMVAGEKDKDIFRLTKEVNDLRIQNSILRNKSNACARKLEATLQITSETALSHMVQGSNAVVEMIQHIKNFMIEREKIEISARQSAVDSTPSTEKVQRVPPLMLGGRSIQPVVSLSRTILPHNILTESRQPNENHNSPVRPLPMRVLQELYIPLTRIDADTISPDDMENNQDTSIEDMGLEDHNDDVPEQEDDVATPRDSIRKNLSAVLEESVENVTTNVADPLEGPSRLLDTPNVNGPADQSMHEFTPTLRRRKRLSSPRADPSPIFVPYPRHKKIDRTLKVVLAKMRLDDYKNNGAGVSPPKKQMMEEAESSTKNNNSSPGTSSSWNSPGPSQNTLCYKPGPSGEQRISPWDKHGHPQEKSRSPWNKSGPSEDKSTEPWDQPGPSRNKHISPSYKPKGNSSRDNDYLEEVSPQEMRSSQDYQERCSRENRKETNLFSKKLAHRTRVEVPKCQGQSEDSARENSPFSSSNIRMSIDSPAKLVGDIVSRSRDAHFDVYRFSLDSQNNDIERAQIFDAPSPKGSTNARVIVQEAQTTNSEIRCSSRISKHSDRTDNSSELDEDFQEKRTRRTRKCVSYKEKPLNRKLRR